MARIGSTEARATKVKSWYLSMITTVNLNLSMKVSPIKTRPQVACNRSLGAYARSVSAEYEKPQHWYLISLSQGSDWGLHFQESKCSWSWCLGYLGACQLLSSLARTSHSHPSPFSSVKSSACLHLKIMQPFVGRLFGTYRFSSGEKL